MTHRRRYSGFHRRNETYKLGDAIKGQVLMLIVLLQSSALKVPKTVAFDDLVVFFLVWFLLLFGRGYGVLVHQSIFEITC